MTPKNHSCSEAEEIERDSKGRFLAGNRGNGGRPRGARSRLGEQFIQSLADDFEVHGITTIELVRKRSPETYIKVISNILPREVLVQAFTHTKIDLASVEQAEGFLEAYRFARDRIGAPVTIEAKPIDD